jgi:hypothetical protein
MTHIITCTAEGFNNHLRCNQFDVLIESNDYYFTIYDNYGEPCGTIIRPRADGKDSANGKWQVYNCHGQLIAEGVGPRSVFRRFIMAYDAYATDRTHWTQVPMIIG